MRPLASSLSDRRFLLTFGLLALAVIAAYLSVIVSHYAFADDFMTLYAVHSKTPGDKIAPFYNTQGRPLGGVIVEAVFRAAWTLDGLNGVRAASLGLALVCGWIFAAEFRRVVPWWIGLGAVSMLLLNPAVSVFVAWANSGMLSLPAVTLALLGGVGWRRTLERGEARGLRFWLRVAGAGSLGLAALLIYQPCACFFLLPAAIGLLKADDARAALRTGTWTAGGFTVLCAGYFAAFQIVRPHLGKAEDIVVYRADLVRDVTGRVWFFLSDVLPRSFESWTVFFGAVPRGIALCAVAISTALFLVRLARTPGGRFVRLQALLLVPVLFGLASSPLLVVKDDYAPFRTLAVLYSLVVVGFTGGILEIWRWMSAGHRAGQTALALSWAGLIVVNGVAAGYVTKEGFVMRSVRELDLYHRYVRLEFADQPKEVIFLLPYPRDVPRFSRIAPTHEFGTASSTTDWSFPGLPYFAFEDEYRHSHSSGSVPAGGQVLIHQIPTDLPMLFPANLPVIDGAQVLKEGSPGDEVPRSGPAVKDDFFGEVQSLTPTLRLSRWFGAYEVLSPTSVVHRELGALEFSSHGGEDCWFHLAGVGWFWTSPKSFPFVFSGERKHWLWYVRGSRRPPEFYDFDAPGRPRVPLE